MKHYLEGGGTEVQAAINVTAHALINDLDLNGLALIVSVDHLSTDGVVVGVDAIPVAIYK